MGRSTLIVLLFLGTWAAAWRPAPAAAQVSVSLNRRAFGTGSDLVVTVKVPPGDRVRKPRFHTLRDGQPLPGGRSRGWIDFPELTSTQDFALRAPEAEGRWWLLLNDGDKLVARVPFDVVDTYTWLQLERDRLTRELGMSASSPSQLPPTSSHARLELAPDQPLVRGRRVDVIVTLPAGFDPRAPVVLRWLGAADEDPATVEGGGLTRHAQVYLPQAAGRHELALEAGGSRLAEISVTVK